MKKKSKTILLVVILAIIGVSVFNPLSIQRIRKKEYHIFDLSADGSCKLAVMQWSGGPPDLITTKDYPTCQLDFNPTQKTTKIHTEQLGVITVSTKKPVEVWQWKLANSRGEGPNNFQGCGYVFTSSVGTKRDCDRSGHCLVCTFGPGWDEKRYTCKEGVEFYDPPGAWNWQYSGKAASQDQLGIHLKESWKVEYASRDPPPPNYMQKEFVQTTKTKGSNLQSYTILSDENDLMHFYAELHDVGTTSAGQTQCAWIANQKYWLYNPVFFAEEERLRNEKERTVHVKLFECPVPTGYSYQTETFTSDFTVNDFISHPAYFCNLEPIRIRTRENKIKYNMSLLEDLVNGKIIKVDEGDTYFVTYIRLDRVIPAPPDPISFLEQLIDDILNWLRGLGFPFTVASGDVYSVNSVVSHELSVSGMEIDNDYSDGTVRYGYVRWSIARDGEEIDNGAWAPVNSLPHTHSFTYTCDSTGEYVFALVLAKAESTYDGEQWGPYTVEIVDQQAYSFTVTPDQPPTPPISLFDQLIDWIVNWLRGIGVI